MCPDQIHSYMSPIEKTDKREHLLLVAEELFSEKGFDGTSVRDIAQAADVNLAMINYYFGSKELLLKALLEFRFGDSFVQIEEMEKNPQLSPMEKIEKISLYYVDKFIGNRRFHDIVSREVSSNRSQEVKDLINGYKLRNFEKVKDILAEGQRKKVFRKVDAEMMMATIIGTINQVINSRKMYCVLLKIDYDNEEDYRKKVTQRLKVHLKQLLQDHLAAR